MSQQRTDIRPHIVPAIYNWLVENYRRVFITAVVDHPDVMIPRAIETQRTMSSIDTYDSTGKKGASLISVQIVTLNFGAEAIGHYGTNEKGMYAKMRFNGRVEEVFVPYESVIGLYSPDDETRTSLFQFSLHHTQANLGAGQPGSKPASPVPASTEGASRRPRPVLTVVK